MLLITVITSYCPIELSDYVVETHSLSDTTATAAGNPSPPANLLACAGIQLSVNQADIMLKPISDHSIQTQKIFTSTINQSEGIYNYGTASARHWKDVRKEMLSWVRRQYYLD